MLLLLPLQQQIAFLSIIAYQDDNSMTKMRKNVHVPILFTAAALLIKLVTIFLLERGDAADLGDEFSAILLYVITGAFLIWQYVRVRHMAQRAEEKAAEALPA